MEIKNRNKIIIAIVSIIIIIGIILIFAVHTKNAQSNQEKSEEENWENPYTEIDKNEVQYQENTTINEIKEETGLTAEDDLYEVNTEYDGRKILSIKADIQYKVAFAGIIKTQLPKMEELEQFVQENHPTENGVWIEEKSRNKFLELLKNTTNSEYEINEKGYLVIKNKNEQNDNDKNLERFINSGKQLVITISNMYYEVDNVTGEIVEYPFEKLDNYQTYAQIGSGDNILFVITSNSNNKLSNKEIIEDLLQNEL